MTERMAAARSVDQAVADMFVTSPLPPPRCVACCRCASTGDDILLSCARHYVCRTCLGAAGPGCPGCVPWTSTSAAAAGGVNGGASASNSHGATTPPPCVGCGDHPSTRRCAACGSDGGDAPALCSSCWQRHQLDVHVLPRLRLDAAGTASCLALAPPGELAAVAAAAGGGSLRQLRPGGPMMSPAADSSPGAGLGSLLSARLSLYPGAAHDSAAPADDQGLWAAGLRDPAARRSRLASLQVCDGLLIDQYPVS